MSRLNFPVALMLAGSVVIQVVGVFFLPPSKGFTVVWPSVATSACVVCGLFLVSRALASGANVSIAVPIVSAGVPLLAVFVGVFLYGDPASIPRIGLLVCACAAIGVATLL